jgi:hypothetical protein
VEWTRRRRRPVRAVASEAQKSPDRRSAVS